VTRHQSEVCTLSGWVSPPFGGPIRPIIGQPSLSPTSSTRCTVPFPCGQDTTPQWGGAHRAYPVDCCGDALRLGWGLSPGGDYGCCCLPLSTDSPPHVTILVTAYQPLWPLPTDEMYTPSLMFNLPVLPWTAPASRLAGYGRRPQGFAQSRYWRCTPG